VGVRLTGDALFGWIESVHGSAPWGDVLDAGTGRHSLHWLRTLPTRSLVGVTADPAEKARLERDLGRGRQPEIVVGDWTDPGLLAGRRFDVVVADYLLGAVDGFAPYFQDRLFARLGEVTAGRLYAVGLAPTVDRGTTPADAAWYDVVALRDAAILLVGDRTYREYPLDWVVRHLASAGFTVDAQASFPIHRSAEAIRRQCDVARRKLPRMSPALRAAMADHIDDVEARAVRLAPLVTGTDWAVAALRDPK
jgi:hypothetical protein